MLIVEEGHSLSPIYKILIDGILGVLGDQL